MALAPLQIFLVLAQNCVDDLVQDVLGGFADEVCVGVQRLVGFVIESRSVPHELLAARTRFDECHEDHPSCLDSDNRSIGDGAKHAAKVPTNRGQARTTPHINRVTKFPQDFADASGRERPPRAGRRAAKQALQGGRSRPDSLRSGLFASRRAANIAALHSIG